MADLTDLTDAASHFEFGKNWRSYARQISETEIDDAIQGMRRLLKVTDLRGASVLDIGCGSGLHALAAQRLGAARILAVDIDEECVSTTRDLLARHSPGHRVEIRRASILEMQPSPEGFDVVYSWGVLHHTGRMVEGLQRAARDVRPGGSLAFALYRRTMLCPFWRVEKRWYRDASPPARERARKVYSTAFRAGLFLAGRNFREYLASYPRNNRGMDFYHDVHDWLGGYPYESISPRRVDRLMSELGFRQVWANVRRDVISLSGILGAGCDEYLYQRT